MTIFLYTRSHRIHLDDGYRDVPIHEITDSELRLLKHSWKFAAFFGACGGFVAGAMLAFSIIPHAG